MFFILKYFKILVDTLTRIKCFGLQLRLIFFFFTYGLCVAWPQQELLGLKEKQIFLVLFFPFPFETVFCLCYIGTNILK